MPTNRPVPTEGKLEDILTYYSDISELGDEMEEWGSNTPDSLQSSDKASMISDSESTLHDAASSLEEHMDAILEILRKVEAPFAAEGQLPVLANPIAYIEHKMYKGYNAPRWVRLSNPVEAMKAAMTFIGDNVGYDAATRPSTRMEMKLHKFMEYPVSEEINKELKEHMEEIDSALGDLDGVNFPSVYG